jgi:hypothetical protein
VIIYWFSEIAGGRELFGPPILWSQNRDFVFRANIHVYNHMKAEQLLCCQQNPKWHQNEQRLFCDKDIYSDRTSNSSSRKGAASKMTDASSHQLLSSYKSGFNRFTWRIRLVLVSYSQKIRTDSGSWRRPIFKCLQEILRSLHQQELNRVFQTWVQRI